MGTKLFVFCFSALLFQSFAWAGPSAKAILKGKNLSSSFILASNPTFNAFNTKYMAHEVVYVDSRIGSDGANGKANAPLRSLAEAQTRVRAFLAANRSQNILVILSGVFYSSAILNLDSLDSPADGYFVTWLGHPKKTATISGGRPIRPAWRLHSQSLNLYVADLSNDSFRSLFVNGRKAQRSTSARPMNMVLPATGNIIDCKSCAIGNVQTPQSIEITRDVQWIADRCTGTLNPDRTIAVPESCMRNLQRSNATWPSNTTRITSLENSVALMNGPDQWSIDVARQKLYYIPRAGESMSSIEFVAPLLEKMIRLNNTKNLAFINLKFRHSNWEQPSSSIGFSTAQAEVIASGELIPAAFECSGCQNTLLMDSDFSNLSGSAIRIGPSSRNNLIFHNTIYDVSGGGIQIGEMQGSSAGTETTHTYVEDNYVTRIGIEYRSSVGIFQAYASNSLIRHNEVSDMPYTGISVGWGWTTNISPNSHDNTISMNLIHDVVKELTDGGGIYTLSAQRGTVLANNFIYNVRGGTPGLNYNTFSNALYLDNGSSYITVRENCVENIATSALFQNPPNLGNAVDSAASCTNARVMAGIRSPSATPVKLVQVADLISILNATLLSQ